MRKVVVTCNSIFFLFKKAHIHFSTLNMGDLKIGGNIWLSILIYVKIV